MYIIAGTKTEDGLLLKDFNYMAAHTEGNMENVHTDHVLMEELPPEYPGEVDINYMYPPYINLTTMAYDWEAVRKPYTLEERMAALESMTADLMIDKLVAEGVII